MKKVSIGNHGYPRLNVLNNTIHSAIKSNPSKLLLDYEQRNHADVRLTEFINHLAKIDSDIMVEREGKIDTTKICE